VVDPAEQDFLVPSTVNLEEADKRRLIYVLSYLMHRTDGCLIRHPEKNLPCRSAECPGKALARIGEQSMAIALTIYLRQGAPFGI
jgi:hypothetical protein